MVTKTEHGFVQPTQLEEEMRTSYMDYAMSVIVARALPDVRDGLKPVQRKILYGMQGLGMRPNSGHKKSARLVGEVHGKYHPHGETAIYDAMVRMAQPFSMSVPLVDGQGNYGSVDGDPPAAQRYTEARLTVAAEEMLDNLDEDTVDFDDNYDGNERMPTVLPARLPNLLVNGSTGIAVGMATNIPPHNPTEICNGILLLIRKPEATVENLMTYVKGPDFPTGATIMGLDGVRAAYATGRGQIIVRAVMDMEEVKRSNRSRIVVTELPYQVNKATLIEKIALLVKSRRIEGITEIRDESNREGMRIVMEMRSGAQYPVIRNNLYKFTNLQASFSANMLALVDGTPRVITLKAALQAYIDFRRQVITRRSEYRLRRARDRAHILEGLRIALANVDAIIALIRGAADVEAARKALMSWYDLDELQAQAILDMQLRRLAALERERIENEYRELQKTIDGLEEMLGDPEKVLAEVKGETSALKKKIGLERRTGFSEEALDFRRGELEPHEQVVVTLSQGGYIKRIPSGTYRNQHRGGKGVTGMTMKDDDPIRHIVVGDTHDILLFFTDRGRVLNLKSYELRADASRNTRGVPVRNVIALGENESVNAIVDVPNLEEKDLYLAMVTRKGRVERVPLEELAPREGSSDGLFRRSGLIIMRLRDDDELVTARLVNAENDLTIVTEGGQSIRFAVEDVTAHHRGAGGVKGMALGPKDNIVAMDKVVPDSKLLVISRNGYGKLTDLNRYRRQGRAGSGIMTLKVTRKTGKVAAAEVIADSDEVYVVSEKAQVLRTNLSEIRSVGRATQGVRIFKAEPGDHVASIACVRGLESTNGDDPPARRNGSGNGKVPKDALL